MLYLIIIFKSIVRFLRPILRIAISITIKHEISTFMKISNLFNAVLILNHGNENTGILLIKILLNIAHQNHYLHSVGH